MIWIWIVAAVLISWLFCKRGIGWYHYIWLLLPIEMYGVTIAGATVKPYMLFGICIIVSDFIRNKTIRVHTTIIAVTFALIISDFLTGFVTSSVMQHIMFILIVYIAYCYVSVMNTDRSALESIEAVTIATTIGYGVVFALAYIAYRVQPQIGGVYCVNRYSVGMFLRFVSTGGAAIVRLRGFCIDPNAVVTTLIPGAAFALERIIYHKYNKARYVFAVICYGFVVYLSRSRMALICTLVMLLAVLLSGYRQAKNKRNWFVGLVFFVIAVVFVGIRNYQEIAAEVSSFFTSRAGLNDDAGRLTIWKDCMAQLYEHGRLLIGVGQNQIASLTETGKSCHNTWLEWVCGTGLLIGGGISIWFLTSPIRFVRYAKRADWESRQYMPLLFAYLTTVVCITTVDNITNSILIFLMTIFNYGRLDRIAESQEQSEWYG